MDSPACVCGVTGANSIPGRKMTIKILCRIETYETGGGWEYQIQQYVNQTELLVGFHDSQGQHKTEEYETEEDALLASKRSLKRMVDSTIKDLNAKRSVLRRFAN